MQLSAERFEQIVTSLKSDAICGRNSEQRSAPRVGLRVRVRIALRDAKGVVARRTVWVRNVSTSGIGIVDTEPIKVGTHFVVYFEGRGDSMAVLYSAVRCLASSGGVYSIGAKFERYLTGKDN